MRFNDVDLARRLLAGDPSVLDELSVNLWPLLSWRVNCRFRKFFTSDDLDDLAQEWLLRLWSHRGDYDPDRGSLVSWAFTIALNAARDRLRRDPEKQGRSEHGVDLVEFDPAEPPPYAEAEKCDVSMNVRCLRECLAHVPERQRDLLFARFTCDGEPPTSRELAELFHSTPAAVRKQISRLVAKIRRHFGLSGNRPGSESSAGGAPEGGG